MRCRRLNEEGINLFKLFLEKLPEADKIEAPIYLLEDRESSEELAVEIDLERPELLSRYELGLYLVNKFRPSKIQEYISDEGFWSWLALYWFNDLCPKDKNGRYKPAMYYNYIMTKNPFHRPRHAIRTTFLLVDRYAEDSRFLLMTPLKKRGELTEQLFARQYLSDCEGVVRAASYLYFDPEKTKNKRGAAGKGRGSSRRFMTYLKQIELTYDLYTIHPKALLEMLPSEYDRFLSKS